jgi:23S rRNA (guanosine2251-2'-O)-methyltransferase
MNRKLKNEELNRISADEFKHVEKSPIIIVLDNIRSLNNIGSVFRTADAFGVEKIYLCGITAIPPHREIQKTALGATETVSWQYVQDIFECVHSLKQEYDVYAVEQTENSAMLNELKLESNKKTVLVFGNEVEGVNQEIINLCNGVIEIPQIGTKHSINVAVSVGIVVWELFKRKRH